MWFGPRSAGVGWTPVTWQGWATFALFLLGIGSISYFGRDRLTQRTRVGLVLALVALLLVVLVAKGGPPG